MVKFDEVKLFYTCFANPPEGVYMNKVYRIIKKDGKLYFTDGTTEFVGEEEYIKMLFSPQDVKISWEDVDFTDEVKITKMFDKK